MKKVIIAGGTGFIGTCLTSRFLEYGYDVIFISRLPDHVQWDENELTHAFERVNVIINLAGKTINCSHTAKNRKAIIQTRVDTTTMIGNAIKNCKTPPELWINASATGIYQPSVEIPMTEDSPVGNDFLAEVVKKWEAAFFNFKLPHTRQVALRTSMVLGENGGALEPLAMLTKLGLGGKQASGKQMISWIHEEDYFNIILFILQNPTLSGVINCTSPEPVSNKVFMKTMRQVLNIRVGIPAPAIVIRLISKLIGKESKLILNSSNVLPKRLLEAGFKFTFADIDSALTDVLNKL